MIYTITNNVLNVQMLNTTLFSDKFKALAPIYSIDHITWMRCIDLNKTKACCENP